MDKIKILLIVISVSSKCGNEPLSCFTCVFLQGFTTLVLNCSQEMHNIGFAWRGLKEQLGEEIDDQIRRMTFLKGRKVRYIAFCHSTVL